MSNTTKQSFAGVAFKPTKHGKVARPALLKMLRSSRVTIECTGRYTDDYAYDAGDNFGKRQCDDAFADELADDIERSPSGWHSRLEDDGLHVSCHSFLSYRVRETAPVAIDPHVEEVARLEAWIG